MESLLTTACCDPRRDQESGGRVTDPDDLTELELCELSCFMPNLACVIDREPPRMVEETRRSARQELACLLREMVRLRTLVP